MEDPKNVPPMEQRRLVTFINHFITSTVTFLNNFMTHCEAKMMKSEQRLQKISASLCILETKLNSVPELQELVEEQMTTKEPISHLEDGLCNTETTDEPIIVKDNISNPVELPIVEDNSIELKAKDPTILKYRKMLQFGVPRGAVELKMVHEGLDPKLL